MLYVLGGAMLVAITATRALHPATVVVSMVVFQFGNGMVMPNTIAGAIAPFPRTAGAASALAGFVQMIVGALTGVVLGRLHDGSARPMACCSAASSSPPPHSGSSCGRRGDAATGARERGG